MGALKTTFIRLAIVSQYGRAAVAGWYCMYSAEWQAVQDRKSTRLNSSHG